MGKAKLWKNKRASLLEKRLEELIVHSYTVTSVSRINNDMRTYCVLRR